MFKTTSYCLKIPVLTLCALYASWPTGCGSLTTIVNNQIRWQLILLSIFADNVNKSLHTYNRLDTKRGRCYCLCTSLLIFPNRFQIAASQSPCSLWQYMQCQAQGTSSLCGCVHSDLYLHGHCETGLECAHSPQSCKTRQVPHQPLLTFTFFCTNSILYLLNIAYNIAFIVDLGWVSFEIFQYQYSQNDTVSNRVVNLTLFVLSVFFLM